MEAPVNQPPAISLRNVSKKYQLYASLGHRVYEALHPFKKQYHREFWALRDINLDIPRGATVGILGVNGSGKSTLLQIVCSIMQPTSGTVEVRGKVAALIELGAGFNPDLTGRENAEINCAIQGLDAKTVRDRLPEIEAFADIGEFFDQPVKTYSSGMFMRVAFATAINVDPEILIIDEALAVGDARFQQKCFAKFRDFQAQGKTILLVTHDRFSVPRLCDRAILLNHGALIASGTPTEVVNLYAEVLSGAPLTPAIQQNRANPSGDSAAGVDSTGLEEGKVQAQAFPDNGRLERALNAFMQKQAHDDYCPRNPTYNKDEHRYGNKKAVVIDYLLVSDGMVNPGTVVSRSKLDLYTKVLFKEVMQGLNYGLSLLAKDGVLLYGNNTLMQGMKPQPGEPGEVRVYKISVDLNLAPGDVFLTFGVAEGPGLLSDIRQGCAYIRVTDDLPYTGLVSLPVLFKEC